MDIYYRMTKMPPDNLPDEERLLMKISERVREDPALGPKLWEEMVSEGKTDAEMLCLLEDV